MIVIEAAENVIQLPYKWTPREDQLALWMYFQGGGKRGSVIAHRRWGKDDVALRIASVKAHERVGNYWHMLPEYGQARKAIWEAINPTTGKYRIDETFPQDIRSSTRNTDMVLQLKVGSQWQMVGSDNFNSVVGSPPIGVVFSEWALADPLAWAYIQPILEQNGGWALFITSSRGNNHAYRTHDNFKSRPDCFSQILRADQTDVFSPAQLESIKTELVETFGRETGLTIFNQEYLCSREGAILGAYYARQIEQARKEGRISRVPHRPDIEVFTAWDLGVDDSMTIWFIQPIGKGFNVIDYYENSGYGLEHYAKVLKEKDYNYAGHYMPHDAAEREMTSGEIARSRVEVAEDLGIRPIMVVERARNINIIMQVHIPAVRNILPLCSFDEEKCAKGIAGLESYHSEYDEKNKVLGSRPKHNWASHPSDAFRTFAVGYEDIPTHAEEGRSGSRFSEFYQSGVIGSENSSPNSWRGLP